MGVLVKYLRILGDCALGGEAAMYTGVLAASEFLGIVGASALLCASRGFRATAGLDAGLFVNSRHMLSTDYSSELGTGQSIEC